MTGAARSLLVPTDAKRTAALHPTDWKYLYNSFRWSKEQVDRNMRRLLANQSRTSLIVTEFEPDSIMLCSLPVEAFPG